MKAAGIKVTSIDDLMMPGLDWETVNVTIHKFLRSKNMKTKLTPYLLTISKFIILQRKLGYKQAKQFIETMEKEDRKVCVDLRKVGLQVKSVYDLVNTADTYPGAIPVLLKWLPILTNVTIKEGVVRALTIKNAGDVVKNALIREFERHRDTPDQDTLQESLQWAIGNAISVVAKKDDAETIIEFVKDKRYGAARQMLISYLAQRKIHSSIGVLIVLLDEDNIYVYSYAIKALSWLRAKEAKKPIERFLTHSNPSFRKEAQKALDKIGN